MNTTDAPIVVSGLGRSGTTWVSHLLKEHRLVDAVGQPPNGAASVTSLLDWYDDLGWSSQWAYQANQKGIHETWHYCEPKSLREDFATFVRRLYGAGVSKQRRWSIKMPFLIGDPRNRDRWEWLFPRTTWVCCLRDPVLAAISARTNISAKHDYATIAQQFVELWKFCQSTSVVFFQIELVNQDNCYLATHILLGELGFQHTPQTEEFARRYPRIHCLTKTPPEREVVTRVHEEMVAYDVDFPRAYEWYLAMTEWNRERYRETT